MGVRPTGPNADVDLEPPGDENGNVIANDKGLSVSADWKSLPGFLIPEHLDDGFNGASGKKMAVFVLGSGTGPFVECVVSQGLVMIFKNGTSIAGVIRPTVTILLSKFQADLAATRDRWVVDES